MPSLVRSLDGKRVENIELLDIFPPNDGMISQYYGRIGSGKTYSATADILDLLRKGAVVYANWKIHYNGYDERHSNWHVLASIIFPWKKRFYLFPKENLRFIEVDANFHDNFAKLTDCHVFLDEGHVAFDSYEMARMSIEKRKNILHTRHFDRSIHIISQRPTAVHVTMRANVNVFYKCEQKYNFILQFFGVRRFKRTEFQDMKDENVDEDEEKIISVKHYWGHRRIFEAYDTKYLRGDLKASQRVAFRAYEMGIFRRLGLFFWNIFKGKGPYIAEDEPVFLAVPLPPPGYNPAPVFIKVRKPRKKKEVINTIHNVIPTCMCDTVAV
jgi:hypothetical protein